MMKLKPMKSPSTPPQSATREPKEKASSSLITWMDPLENFGTKSVDSIGCLDSSTTYFEINLLFWLMIITITVTHPILHESTWHKTLCILNELLCVHEKYSKLLIIILTQSGLIFTQRQTFCTWSHPWWLTSCLSQNASFYTSRKIVFRILLTCTWRLVEFFMSYCLKR